MIADSRLADDVPMADAKGMGGGAGDAQSKLVKDIMSRQLEQEAAGRVDSAGSKDQVHKIMINCIIFVVFSARVCVVD